MNSKNPIIKLKVGDTVKWIDSNYTVIEIKKDKAYLKQNFSIGIVLNKPIPLEELELI